MWFANAIMLTYIVIVIICIWMNSPKYNNFMTTVKQEIESKNKRKYSNMKEQKNMTFYNLYKDKIIIIQRWYRACLTRKLKKMEKSIN